MIELMMWAIMILFAIFLLLGIVIIGMTIYDAVKFRKYLRELEFDDDED